MARERIKLKSPGGVLRLTFGSVQNGTELEVLRRTSSGGFVCILPGSDTEFGVPPQWATRILDGSATRSNRDTEKTHGT